MIKKVFVLIGFPWLAVLYFFVNDTVLDEYTEVSPQINLEDPGKELAGIYCASCHKFPDPKSLDKATWKNSVLPNMGLRLGLKIDGKKWDAEMDPVEVNIVRKLNIYPENAIISKKDWTLIKKYYLENAPEVLPTVEREEKSLEFQFPFNAQTISLGDSQIPQVSLLRYDATTSKLYIGDNKSLFVIDNISGLVDTYDLDSPASYIDFDENGSALLLTMGKLNPSDQSLGSLYRIGALSGTNKETVFSNLY